MNNLQLVRRTSVYCFKKLLNLWASVNILENRHSETGQVGRSGTDEYWKSVDLQLEKLVQDISSRFLWLELQKLVQVTCLLVWPSLRVWGWKRRPRNLLVVQVLIKVGFYIFSVQKRIFVFFYVLSMFGSRLNKARDIGQREIFALFWSLLISTLPVHSPAFFPKPLSNFSSVSCG